MKRPDKFLRMSLMGLVVLLLAGGCSKNTIEVVVNQPAGGSGDGGGTTATSLVTFHASIESRNTTRALTPVQKNVRAQIYAFSGAIANASGTPVEQGPYLSPTPGLLQGINGFRMYLPGGIYNFYGVSDNTQFAAPTFTNGVSEPLFNGMDYLWWSGPQQDVTSSQSGIPVVFLHMATQVVFEVQAGQGITINQLALAHIYPSAEGARMNLADGVITPATTYSAQLFKMGINGTLAQYTMLPIVTDVPMKVSFDVILSGEPGTRTYEVDVPLPDGALKAGDSYRFLAVIEGNEVTFPQVSVRSWVDVDETGKPLYPSET